MYYLSYSDFFSFLNSLKNDFIVFLPREKNNQLFYEKYTTPRSDLIIGKIRAVEPLKSFFYRAREVVARDFKVDLPSSLDRLAIVGVKACDLKSLKIQDYVFGNHNYKDPFYLKARQENLIISSDCTSSLETCFCVALGGQPYSQEGFDINFSSVEEGFVVEFGSFKGERVLNKYSSLFKKSREFISARDEQRAKVKTEVERNIRENDIPSKELYKGIIERTYQSGVWKEQAQTCVECGACNTICPTCHCFLLYDQKNEENLARLRMWDSCMIKDFARVGGGANPREKLWMRLRNRFEKKFDFFPKVAGIYACTGCGRCISACPGKIDIRKVLRRLVADESL